MYILVDCNNFFVSCERIFRPDLANKPVAVLSNNDGCIVARSKEVKEMGIPMGLPAFQLRNFNFSQNITLFSGNFRLYGDISNRVMSILKEFSPDVEIYSIDEAFIKLPYAKVDRELLNNIKRKILKYTGIPVSVGAASTKTLAKVAVEIAKKNPTLNNILLIDGTNTDDFLRELYVNDIWGIGRRYSLLLNKNGIYSALDFKNHNTDWIRQKMSVTGERVQLELKGVSCIQLNVLSQRNKTIISSRSFSHSVKDLNELKEAVSSYMTIASRKLRSQGSLANIVSVTLRTSKFTKNTSYFHKSQALQEATSYTPTLIKVCTKIVDDLFQKGIEYKKATIILSGIVPQDSRQMNLMQQYVKNKNEEKELLLMESFDKINKLFGNDTIKFASSGLNVSWKASSKQKSPEYTTRWEDIPKVLG